MRNHGIIVDMEHYTEEEIQLKVRNILRNIICIVAAACVVTMTNPLTANATPVLYPDGTIFDAEYYAANNPDVVAVMGNSAQALYQHYVLCGKIEGRLPYNPSIDKNEILQQASANAALSQTLRATDTPIEQLRVALPGTFVTYGVYEQDNVKKNGMEPIEWRVLENTGDSLLLMSRYVLDGVPFSNAYGADISKPIPVTWETCNLRNWLNTTFLTTAFDSTEQSRIMTVKNHNAPTKPLWDATIKEPIDYGNDTMDRVYILSYEEVEKYFPKDAVYLDNNGKPVAYSTALRIKATPYALKHGVYEWTMKTAKACEGYHGGFYSIRYDVVGFVQSCALRTKVLANSQTSTIGADGCFGFRTVTYDMGECPVIRINTK